MSCAVRALEEDLSVVVFDARGLADGATGRNWGFQQPKRWDSNPNLMKIEAENVKQMREFISTLPQEWFLLGYLRGIVQM